MLLLIQGRAAQSVQRLATGWPVRDRIPVGARFSAPVQTSPVAHPASCTMGTGSFPGVKSSRGLTLTPRPLLVPWSSKSRATPLLLLWAVRPVHSLSACTTVHCTFHLYYLFDVVTSISNMPQFRSPTTHLCWMQKVPLHLNL
jgi:hypothetical protein